MGCGTGAGVSVISVSPPGEDEVVDVVIGGVSMVTSVVGEVCNIGALGDSPGFGTPSVGVQPASSRQVISKSKSLRPKATISFPINDHRINIRVSMVILSGNYRVSEVALDMRVYKLRFHEHDSVSRQSR